MPIIVITFCAEYCFTPNEALLKQGDNLFNAELLSDQITQIRVFKNYTKPEQTALIWDGNNEGKINFREIRPYWQCKECIDYIISLYIKDQCI